MAAKIRCLEFAVIDLIKMRPDLKVGIQHGRRPRRWMAPEKLDRVFETRPTYVSIRR
jgi:hypothetical protein